MARRLEQLNEQLKSELAYLIVKSMSLNHVLITVSYVECSPDLKYAKIGISVLPDKYAHSSIEKLKKQSNEFSHILRKKLKIRQIPRFNWTIDSTEKKAAEIENILKEIKKNN